MNISEIVSVSMAVITNIKVIIAFAVVLIFWAFISFVLYYKKGPPRPKGKGKKIPSSSPALNASAEASAQPAEDSSGEAAPAEE
ncbi:MAG: hypothetical protein KBT02_00530 [Treponema sp.]|nr:hypothetical protein [Candidatus Treponema caballi]